MIAFRNHSNNKKMRKTAVKAQNRSAAKIVFFFKLKTEKL